MTAISSIHITIKRPAFQIFSYRYLSPVLPTPFFGILWAPISITPQQHFDYRHYSTHRYSRHFLHYHKQIPGLYLVNNAELILLDTYGVQCIGLKTGTIRIGTDKKRHAKNITPVIYTSRTELQFDDQESRLAFGEQVSAFLMDVVRNLPVTTGFLISKGGITSNDVLSDGLALRTSRVAGQILAGCSVVRCPDDHPRFPGMPVVIFPGNVGDENALATVLQRLRPDH